MEEISKPVTLSFRLFGNIVAGEIVLELLNGLAPYLTPIIWLVFSLFVGVIQAFAFYNSRDVILGYGNQR